MANPLVKIKRRMSNKSLVATFIAITIAVTLLFSVAVIFAFNQQSISSSVRITYKTVDITGSVTMYAKAGSATEFYKGTDAANKIDEFVFDVETETTETPAQLDLSNAELTKQNNTLYIHYVFENSGQRAYTAILSYLETEVYTQNMELKYSQTGEDGSYISSNYGLVVAGGSTKDYYVKISVQDLAYDAEFDGMFTWQLNECDETLTEMEEISLTATTFTVVDETKNEYSAQYNGEDISISGITTQANDGIENIWYVPGNIGAGKVVSVIDSGVDEDFNPIQLPENTKVVIADGVQTIAGSAFSPMTYGCGIVEIGIPDSVTTIGDYAFENCTNLNSVNLGNGVTSIGTSTFWYCASLTSIEIPNSVTSIGNCAFAYCTSLTSIEIPNSVTSIGDSTFQNCTSLNSVNLGNGVTSIGDSAFYGCSSLTIINYLGDVNSWVEIYFEGYEHNFKYLHINNEPLVSVNIDTATKICRNAFCYVTSLKNITIGDSVKTIEAYAFNGCKGLEEVEISNSVTKIYWEAFYGCTSLTDVYFADIENNWTAGSTTITAAELQNSKTAATYLKETYLYSEWTKVTK